PVSLHGTGGAWLVAAPDADAARFAAVVEASLDRKVCNTLNVCCIVRERAGDLLPRFLDALHRAGERRGHGCKLHIVEGDEHALPAGWLDRQAVVRRAEGDVEEPFAEALALFNRYSPQFDASLVSQDPAAHQRFYEAVNAPFVGDGFTRWVDGQY